ncbi:RNA polymerase sigma factor [Aureliella helgolandensis]|uniref:RNA polymerase sigma factor CnrH n=1 Tax=Aureliella helgolandensis TaxID=2527968 RepID=A0A518FZS0_9BACT|nr:sigma-70 family RNA polymerase sigma factor [Aureliella helgolandensis]QDV21852.1 RNA polymerase sigma factor CnrH [Aureliella helgolandensis]
MSGTNTAEQILVDRISQGEDRAWEDLIARYEGRLLAFVESRIRNRSTSEDIVQETFIGFLNSLPNYDRRRPLESYLFSICAYKLTDCLRREGRRPAISLTQNAQENSSSPWQIVSGRGRGASSIARSGERVHLEEQALIDALKSQIDKWKERGDWTKLMCIELLFVVGLGNKEVAEHLSLTEQQVANFKSDFLTRTKSLVGRQNLNEEVFPELANDS